MKAEFKHSKHGLCLEIQATTKAETQLIQEFMAGRLSAHKPKLKLLKVDDKTSQLRIAHVQLINEPYRDATFSTDALEAKNLDGSVVQLNFSRELRKLGAVTWCCASNFWGGELSYPVKFYIIMRKESSNGSTISNVIEEFTCSSIGELEYRMAKY